MYLRIQSILRSNVSLAFFVPHYAAPSKISLSEDFIENHNYQLSIMRKLAQITACATTSHVSLLGIASCTLRALFPAAAEKSSPWVHLPAKLGKISSQLAILSLER